MLHVSLQKTTLKLHLARSRPQVSQGGLWWQQHVGLSTVHTRHQVLLPHRWKSLWEKAPAFLCLMWKTPRPSVPAPPAPSAAATCSLHWGSKGFAFIQLNPEQLWVCPGAGAEERQHSEPQSSAPPLAASPLFLSKSCRRSHMSPVLSLRLLPVCPATPTTARGAALECRPQ